MEEENSKIHIVQIYEQSGIFVHSIPDGKDEIMCEGKLSIVEKSYPGELYTAYVEWIPVEETECHVDNFYVPNEADWAVVSSTSSSVEYKVDKLNGQGMIDLRPHRRIAGPLSYEINDLRSFRSSSPTQGWAHITFLQKCGATCPTFHFHDGNLQDFLDVLQRYIHIKKSYKEPGLHLLLDSKVVALERSFHELQLFGDQATDLVSGPGRNFRSRRENKKHLKKFFRDPYHVTMGGFSKVTNFLSDYFVHGASPSNRPVEEMVEILHNSLSSIDGVNDEPGFEVIPCTTLGQRPIVYRRIPLTVEEWTTHVASDGHIINTEDLREKIFKGGVEPQLRQIVWKYLTGYYDYNLTTQELQEYSKSKIDNYYRMKLQWRTISPDQERRFSDLRDRRNLVEKDVSRTDRTHPFYAGENNENVQLLNDILMTYCMYNFDLGYVQGMSDLLSPILVVMENEVDAFWCFAGFMERMRHNFEMDQQGIKTQLQQLHTLMYFTDPELSAYLEGHESGNLYFCFRWLLILFKREYSFTDIMRLWEVIWTDLPCKNFHLLLCLAILDTEKNSLMENRFGFTEILKHINDLSLHIRLEETLCKAEAMYLQLLQCKHLPQTIRDIIGLPPLPEVASSSSKRATPTYESANELNGDDDSEDDAELKYQAALDLQFI